MKNLCFIILFFCFSGCANAKEVQCFNQSENLIKKIYEKFPIGGENNIENSDEKTLNSFFSKDLSSLIYKDKKCREKFDGICNIDFNILINQQDVPNDKGYKILQVTNNLVTVKIEYPQFSEFVNYMIDNSSNCKKIKNINYDDGTDLRKILSKKYD